VFVHGGFWQYGTIKEAGFMAENFVEKGYLYATIGYDLAPKSEIFFLIKRFLKIYQLKILK
jgi:acetyl esterase/lipase